MALNIAVQMSGVGDLLEGFGLLSPISPVNIDFRSSIKNPLSPVGSESSGVSSLDLEDIKKQMPTLMDENEESDGSSGPGKSPSNTTVGSTMSSAASSRTCSTSSSSSTASDDYSNQMDENELKSSDGSSSNDDEDGAGATSASAPPSLTSTDVLGSNANEGEKETVATGSDGTSRCTEEEVRRSLEQALSKELNELPLLSPKTLKEPIFSVPRTSIYYNSRDILNLGSNIRPQGTTPGEFAFQFAELPETNNIQFFLQNRSQYHRLGPNGHVQEFRMATCACCDFQYPVNTVGANSYAATAVPSAANQGFGTSNLANLNANQIYGNLQQQQQQQQHQQQMRLQQQQLQMQYTNRYNNNANGNSMGREYNMYNQQAACGMGGASNAAGGGLQSSRFNNGVYGSANVLPGGGSLQNAHNILGGSSGGNNGFFNNNLLQGRDQYNPMASGMGMQYNNAGTTPKGISQSNGTLSQSAGQLRQQQQYDMFQQQKQYLNNYAGLGSAVGNNGVNVAASSNAAAVRLQQQQQSQQASHYYKKPQTIRYGGAGVNNTMPSSGGLSTSSNWKPPMANNNTFQDSATKLFMELNKMQQQQQQQQSQYYVPFQ